MVPEAISTPDSNEYLAQLVAEHRALGSVALDGDVTPEMLQDLPTFSTPEEARAVFGISDPNDWDKKTVYRAISEADFKRILTEGMINSNFQGDGRIPAESISVLHDPGSAPFRIAQREGGRVIIAFQPDSISFRGPHVAIAPPTPADRIVGAARFAPLN